MNPVKVTYKLEFDEFSDYNEFLAGDIIGKSKKKVTTCGIFEIIFSCALFLYNFILGDNNLMLFIMALPPLYYAAIGIWRQNTLLSICGTIFLAVHFMHVLGNLRC